MRSSHSKRDGTTKVVVGGPVRDTPKIVIDCPPYCDKKMGNIGAQSQHINACSKNPKNNKMKSSSSGSKQQGIKSFFTPVSKSNEAPKSTVSTIEATENSSCSIFPKRSFVIFFFNEIDV